MVIIQCTVRKQNVGTISIYGGNCFQRILFLIFVQYDATQQTLDFYYSKITKALPLLLKPKITINNENKDIKLGSMSCYGNLKELKLKLGRNTAKKLTCNIGCIYNLCCSCRTNKKVPK